MKIRSGFVSNSSSASFTVRMSDLSVAQMKVIELHREEAGEDAWSIYEEDGCVHGFTRMDNFDMRDYLRHIGVDTGKVDFREG